MADLYREYNLFSYFIYLMSVIVALLLVLGTYYFNYLGTAVGIGGMKVANLSQVFPFPYMPPGVFFMIAWTLIFALIGIFAVMMLVHYFKHKKINHKLMWLFSLTSLLNMAWVYITSMEFYAWAVVIIALMMITLMRMLNIYKKERMQNSFGRWVFGAYYGWISMATTVLSLSILIYLYNPTFALTSTRTWIAIAIGVLVTLFSFLRRRNIAALLLSLWALTGAIIAYLG